MDNIMYEVFKTTYENFQKALSKEFLIRNWLHEDVANIDNFEIVWPKVDLVKTVTAVDGTQYVVINLTFTEHSCRHHIERKIPINTFIYPTRSNISQLIIQFLEDDGMAYDMAYNIEVKYKNFLRELHKRFEPMKMDVDETYEQAFLRWLDNVIENPIYKWGSSKKQFVSLSDSNLRGQDNPNDYKANNNG